MDSARSANPSSSIVFPGTPDSMVFSKRSLPLSLSSVDGAGVLGICDSCLSIVVFESPTQSGFLP